MELFAHPVSCLRYLGYRLTKKLAAVKGEQLGSAHKLQSRYASQQFVPLAINLSLHGDKQGGIATMRVAIHHDTAEFLVM